MKPAVYLFDGKIDDIEILSESALHSPFFYGKISVV